MWFECVHDIVESLVTLMNPKDALKAIGIGYMKFMDGFSSRGVMHIVVAPEKFYSIWLRTILDESCELMLPNMMDSPP